MKNLLKIILIFVLVLGSVSVQAKEPVRYELDNGFTVILKENHEAPVVAFQVWVRAGSANEQPHEYGITHLIEHMIFKGTPTDPKGLMAKRIEALGGDINAYTTLDHTNYWAVAPSYAAGEVLKNLADAVVNAWFDQNELAKEKEVVFEEIRMGQDSPSRRRSKALLKAVFGPDHPYGHPTIGSMESVGGITRQNILDYMKRWYRASNMMLVAVGDFNSNELIPEIADSFAGLPGEPALDFNLPEVTTPKGPRLLVLKEKVKQASISLAWPIPGLPDPDVYALDMASSVAGDAETSRLNASLKEKQGLVDSISAYAYTPEGYGFFSVSASLNPDKVNQAWPAMLSETLSLISRQPTKDELNKARVALSASFIRGRQTMKAQANTLGYFEMMHGGFEQVDAYTERFKSVTAAEVQEAAEKYLNLDNLLVVMQVPEGASVPDQAQLQELAAKVYADLKTAPPAPPMPSKAIRKELANGITLLVKTRNSLPLVSFNLVAPGGFAGENKDNAGLHQLWSRTLDRGSRNYTYDVLAETLDNLAGSVGAFTSRHFSGLKGSFLAKDAKEGLSIMADLWLHPTFEDEQLKRAKAEQYAQLRRQVSSPTGRTFLKFRELFYGDHPYALNPLGSQESLVKLSGADLMTAHAKLKGTKGLVLSVVGDVDPDQVEAWVTQFFAGAEGEAKQPQLPEFKAPSQPRELKVDEKTAKQSQIVLGWLAPNTLSKERHALNLLEAILGGMGGRLFLDLRDTRSLAYSISPFYTAGYQLGVFGIYMGVGPGKEQEALAGLNEHLERVRTEPPSDEELSRAKAQMLGSLAIGLQTYGSQAEVMMDNEALGRGYLYHEQLPKEIEAVTAEDVRAAAAKYLRPENQVRLVLGP